MIWIDGEFQDFHKFKGHNSGSTYCIWSIFELSLYIMEIYMLTKFYEHCYTNEVLTVQTVIEVVQILKTMKDGITFWGGTGLTRWYIKSKHRGKSS